MPQIKVERVRGGQHPSEVVVSVRTADGGTEKLVVDERSIRNGCNRRGISRWPG
jgi:hypothetical protein